MVKNLFNGAKLGIRWAVRPTKSLYALVFLLLTIDEGVAAAIFGWRTLRVETMSVRANAWTLLAFRIPDESTGADI